MWIYHALLSAVLLAIYDLLKKAALKDNAVLPVLFLASLSGALIFLVLILLSKFSFITTESVVHVPDISRQEHAYYFLKACVVGSSWVLAYYALRHLPLTIVSPIRSTAPLWTIIGAVVIFSERLSLLQWTGAALTLACLFLFSAAGKKEGIHFRTNKWILFIFLATIVGAISALYDKFLIAHFHRLAVQSWFSIYMVVVQAIFLLLIWLPVRRDSVFKWHWGIPLIGISLALADFFYFYALSCEDSLLSLISVIRRSNVVLAFLGAAYLFKEGNLKAKGLALTGILVGLALIVITT